MLPRRARAAIAALGLLACGWPAGAAERILALAPHIAETLYAIGAGEEIVGVVSFVDHPEAAKALPRIGNYRKISVEGALRLEPTLAIAMDEDVIGFRDLRDFGIRIETSHPKTVVGVFTNIERMGSVTGHEAEARRLAASLRARLERVRANRLEPPLRVFYEIWHEPLIAAGGTSFISDALSEIGAKNVFADQRTEGPRVAIEAVLRARPDVLIIPGESRDVAERARAWRALFPGGQIAVVEAPHDLLHRPGPRLLDGMETLQASLRAVAANEQP